MRVREECLNAHWFLSFDDARRKIDTWRRYYNEAPALDWMTPSEFARGKQIAHGTATETEPVISTAERY